jgi:streptomycin 6-kinase
LQGGSIAGWLSPRHPAWPRLRDQAHAWEEQLRKDADELTHTLSRYDVDTAVATVRELGRVQPDILIHGDLHARNILRADREPWLAVDPKGYAGDPAYDGGALLKSRALGLLEADDLRKAVHRALDVFADAAELDREPSSVGPSSTPSRRRSGAAAKDSALPAEDHYWIRSENSQTASPSY